MPPYEWHCPYCDEEDCKGHADLEMVTASTLKDPEHWDENYRQRTSEQLRKNVLANSNGNHKSSFRFS